MKDFNIPEELKKLPERPGVYLMHNTSDQIIYVGKAKVLKNRVRQYFQNPARLSPKIQKMVSNVAWFEYIVVDTELEALVLENNLIKEHQPKYNTMLKDGKTYPFIKVTVGEAFPRVMLSRDRKRDKSRYFGPYTNGVAVNDTIELLRKIYHIRTCNKSLPKEIGKDRPCLYHQLHQCDAPCMGYISKEDYAKTIDRVLDFLNGNYSEVLKILKDKMLAASAKWAFEEAAEYRDLSERVKALAQKQKASDTNEDERDILAVALKDDHCVIQVFFERNGKLLGREHYHMTGVSERAEAEILNDFVKQYYAGTPFIPKELLLELSLPEEELIGQWLTARKGQKVTLRVPKIGNKEKLILLAKENAATVLSRDLEKLIREEKRTVGAAEEIAGLLGLTDVCRMESYDISNTSGFHNVGSMVVFEYGRAKKSDYRKFRIKGVNGPNDYASMEEMLTRRFTHGMEDSRKELHNSFTRFPDLILMDGGKGQVGIAEQVLENLNLNIPVCGMVKDDRHRTRGLYFRNEEIPIDTHGEGFALLTRIQDETHRFAIEYHKSLRGAAQVHSVLDDIPGVGEKRRRALMKYYQSMDAVRAAQIEELAGIPEMNRRAAESVYAYFHKDDEQNGETEE